MWVVKYDRHYFYLRGKSSEYQTRWWLVAALVHVWWKFRYTAFDWQYEVRQVCFFRSEDDVLYLESMRKSSTNPKQLKTLRRLNESNKKRHRR